MWNLRCLAGVYLLSATTLFTVQGVSASPQLFIGSTRNITRHAIVGRGFIERNADLTFGGTSAPIAVGQDGTFYATVHNMGYFPNPKIYAHRRGSSHPYRHFYLHPPFNYPQCAESYGDYATALAVDPQGFEYLGYFNGFTYPPQNDAPYALGSGTTSAPCSGIQVFPPNATEHTQPILYFALPTDHDFPAAMRVAGDGSLYVLGALNPKSIYVFANPSSQPSLVRSMTWQGIETFTGLALDDKRGMMYVASVCGACNYGRLYTFPEQFTPSQLPLASFLLPDQEALSVESFDSKLFVSSLDATIFDKTFVYNKVGPVRNRPTETLDVSGPLAVSP